MHYEARTIYKRGRNYVLVMSTSSSGIHMAYIDHRYQYAMLPELKVDDIGYVEFDRIHYIPWYKLDNNVEVSVYKKMSDRQFNAVINTLSNMFTGIIIKHKTVFMYADEITEQCEITAPIIFEPDASEEQTIPDAEEQDTVEIEESNEEPVINDVEESNEEPVINDVEESNEEPVINDSEHYDLPKDIPEMVDEFIIRNEDGSILYDLFYSEKKTTTDTESKYPAKKKSKKNNVELASRRLFTRDEALSIAASTTPVIASKYNINSKIAAKVRRNAKKLFDFEVGVRNKRTDYKGMLDSGMTPEAVAEATNTPLVKIQAFIVNHEINNNATADGNDKLSTYINELIANKDYKALCNIYNMDRYELCKTYNVSSGTLSNFRIKIYQALALNPLYSVFGSDVYSSDIMNKLNDMRKSNTRSIKLDMYNKIMELWDVYYRTLNIHSKFLSGMLDPSDYVDEDNIDYFMSMIWNRFNRQKITDNRIFSKMQKEAIKNNDFYSFCTMFLINPDNAHGSLYNIRKKMLASKDDKK